MESSHPNGPPAVRMQWANLLFIHWRVPAERLRPLIPRGLEIDTFDGSAWVGLIPFTMPLVRLRRLPPIPTTAAFHECNVRTYVRHRDHPGVWFFSLDAASRLAVAIARRFWHLNYMHSRIEQRREGDRVEYEVRRRIDSTMTMRCAWRVGSELPRSRAGDLAHFLTERYALYTADRRGELLRGRIWHEPWPLREAEVLELDDRLVAAAGITVDGAAPEGVYHAEHLDVQSWALERVNAPEGRGGRDRGPVAVSESMRR